MVLLMTDMHVIEGAKLGQKALGDSLPISRHYQKLWAKYDLTQAEYDSNFAYYSRQAEEMNAIYEEVLEHLGAMEARSLGQANTTQDPE